MALAGHALRLSSHLLDDLDDQRAMVTTTPLRATASASAAQRVALLMEAAPLLQLLHLLAIVAYRKACTLKKALKPATKEDTVSFSDYHFLQRRRLQLFRGLL